MNAQLIGQDGKPTVEFQRLWDAMAKIVEDMSTSTENISAIEAAANQALENIENITSDNVITPMEKGRILIPDYNAIIAEQSDIESKATSFSITTEKTNYTNAITALTAYLDTLTDPVDWDDLSEITNCNGLTLRSKFIDVYSTKQLLLNKIDERSKTLADTAQSTANSAQSTANSAQSTANTANTTANTVKRDDGISTSWTSPGDILSASDAGSTATISIAAHARKYSDGLSRNINAGSITGLAFSTTYYVYYDDTSRTAGTKSFQATTNPNTALPGAAAGRHFCGIVTTPADGGGTSTGGYTPPGGYTGPGQIP